MFDMTGKLVIHLYAADAVASIGSVTSVVQFVRHTMALC